ncbi:HesB-like protein [Clostridium subterminale]|uniref:HesB-like protein n=1 Tax=Clostridium subterminale TaxID=1550 RepID=A0ABN1KGP6_CLOSU
MSIVNISDKATTEFLQFLKDNEVTADTVRIHFAGMGCSGAVFNLVLDEKKDSDNIEVVEGLTFLVDKGVTEQFGELTILCADENGRGGFSIEPEIKPEGGGCAGCTSCG